MTERLSFAGHGTALAGRCTFADRADLCLVDEEVRLALAREPHHHVVEVLDPAVDDLAVAQLYGYRHLTIAQRLQVQGFMACLAGGWAFLFSLEQWHGEGASSFRSMSQVNCTFRR